jgi:nitroreductase
MSTLMEIIRSRRSVRGYRDLPVEDEKIRELVEAARLAPSACNSQPWRFVAARGETKRELVDKALGRLVVGNRWAQTAPVVIAACADLSFVTHKVAAQVQGLEFHLLDMGIAVEHLVLRAAELGLGTCWIGWFDEAEVRRVLKIPKGVRVTALVTVGYPSSAPAAGEQKRLRMDEILFWDSYGASHP